MRCARLSRSIYAPAGSRRNRQQHQPQVTRLSTSLTAMSHAFLCVSPVAGSLWFCTENVVTITRPTSRSISSVACNTTSYKQRWQPMMCRNQRQLPAERKRWTIGCEEVAIVPHERKGEAAVCMALFLILYPREACTLHGVEANGCVRCTALTKARLQRNRETTCLVLSTSSKKNNENWIL
jgi:hypothetical protein